MEEATYLFENRLPGQKQIVFLLALFDVVMFRIRYSSGLYYANIYFSYMHCPTIK